MENSILNSIKKLLGISKECKDFDTDIIIHINTAFTRLKQLGVGPSNGFRIEDDTAEWKEYIVPEENLESVKTYIYLKVKLVFDPPSNSVVMGSINNIIKELEWEFNVDVE